LKKYYSVMRTLPKIILVGMVLAMITVLLSILLPAFQPILVKENSSGTWQHLSQYVIPTVLPTTLILVSTVTLLSTLVGVSLAWVSVAYQFPYKKILTTLLLAPLALPSYILGFVGLSWAAYQAPLPILWRSIGWGAFPLQGGLGLAILVMSISLYPYVYFIARQGFLKTNQQTLEAAKTLGHHGFGLFWRVLRPTMQPWLIGGSLLVAMETLADFGTTALLNVDTLTTTLYKTWFSLFDKPAAMQIALTLLCVISVLIYLERTLIQKGQDKGDYQTSAKQRGLQAKKTTTIISWLITVGLTLWLCLVFFAPIGQLFYWSWSNYKSILNDISWPDLWLLLQPIGHSLQLAITAGIATTAVAYGLCRALHPFRYPSQLAPVSKTKQATLSRHRWSQDKVLSGLVGFCQLGYALPGVLLAVSLYWPMALFERALSPYISALLPTLPFTTLLAGSLCVLIGAYVIRFLTVAMKPVEAALLSTTPHMVEASYSLKVTGWAYWKKVAYPLMRSNILTATILVGLDVMKEIPLTLILRPAGFDTLATQIFNFTQEGLWQQAALPSLGLVLFGMVPVFILQHSLRT
jgi:iron(III) transport system permease protein